MINTYNYTYFRSEKTTFKTISDCCESNNQHQKATPKSVTVVE
jgi:hypothetical protein